MLKKSKFTGCLLGSLIGDCLGAPFEMKYFKDDGIKKKEIVATIQKTLDRRDELFKYTGKFIELKFYNYTCCKFN